MGHLLKTMNPEAVERIENGPDSPDVGTVVVYIARPGMQRMGRREFPAIVLGADTEGHLELFVMMEPEDMIMESHVRFRDHDQEGHCWRYVESPMTAAEDMASEQIEVLHSSLRQQALEIAELRQLLLGAYKPAKLSVYDLLEEFESKLKKG